jgi:elongation factor G
MWPQHDSEMGTKFEVSAIPADLQNDFQNAKNNLIESVADFDDGIMNQYLAGETVPAANLQAAIRVACIAGKIVPVLCGSAFKNKGIQFLMDSVINFLPSPSELPPTEGFDPDKPEKILKRNASAEEPFSGLAFKLMNDAHAGNLTFVRIYSGTLKTNDNVMNVVKRKRERVGRLMRLHANKREDIDVAFAGEIVAIQGLRLTTTGETLCDDRKLIQFERMDFPEPVISVAVEPKTKADQPKLFQALDKLASEDPSLTIAPNEETGQMLVSGMGELHLEIILDRLVRDHRVEANVGKPQVAYKETIVGEGQAQAEISRALGGKVQFGQVSCQVRPQSRGAGNTVLNLIPDKVLPLEIKLALESSFKECLSAGFLAGFPLVDVLVEILSAEFREGESVEVAYRAAAGQAFKEAAGKAGQALLEPIMKASIIVPVESVGDVVSDLGARRSKILSMDSRPGGVQVISAEVPLEATFGYSTVLRSRTQGRGTFALEFDRYDRMPVATEKAVLKKFTGFDF